MTSTKGLVVLESRNPILYDQLNARILGGKRESCEVFFSDFDDVSFKLSCSSPCLNIIKVNMAIRNAAILRRMGTEAVLNRLFPGLQMTPDASYDFALEFDCDTLTDRENMTNNISNLKNVVFGGPLDNAFQALSENRLSSVDMMTIPFRKTEAMYVCPGSAKVVVVFLVDFIDATDRAFARVFLQEFVEAQRSIRTSPPVAFSREPPGELASLGLSSNQDIAGYISFAFEERHVTGARKDHAVTLLTGFRTYLHYHIKCSKTYLHIRMRKKVDGWMQVLNRAMPEVEHEKKTITGRTFTRK
eukprot:gene9037-18716_t